MAGQDLIMAASASDTTSPEVMRELARLRLDPKLRAANYYTRHGFGKDPESPLDWASRHGDTPVTRLLSELTGEQPHPEPADRGPRFKAQTARAAIEKALPLLYEAGREFFKRSGCTSCHHNMLPALAFSLARAKGIVVQEEKKYEGTTCNRPRGSRVRSRASCRTCVSPAATPRPPTCCGDLNRTDTNGIAPPMPSCAN